MKKIHIILFVIVAALTACTEVEYKRKHYPDSQPVIEEVSIKPVLGEGNTVNTGDSIEVSAVVSDPLIPLSTLEIQIIVQDRLVGNEKIRTKDQHATPAAKFRIPFYANMPDNIHPEIYLRLENVEGNAAELTIPDNRNVTIKRPAFGDKLYFVMEDKTVYTANRQIGSTTDYATSKLNIESTKVRFRIAEKITQDNQIDYSGYVWGYKNGELTTIEEGEDLYEYSDPLITKINRFRFNIFSFGFDVDADRVDPVSVNGRRLEKETISNTTYMTLTLALTEGAEVVFSGIGDLGKALNPDFFSNISGNKATFTGLTGSYKLLQNPTTGFVHIQQPEATYPNALWICGEGLGFAAEPYSTSTRWGWDKPEDYIFCRKISDGVFQTTFYTQSSFNMKFYHINTWDKGEELSSDYTLSPANLLQKSSDGNWVSGTGVTSGVYRVTINVNDKTTLLEVVN